MRRGLKLPTLVTAPVRFPVAARAAPYEKGTETHYGHRTRPVDRSAARAAPYEKGTETTTSARVLDSRCGPRARPPMRRGLKREQLPDSHEGTVAAARAAPYEKGTETLLRRRDGWGYSGAARRAAPYEKGTETCNVSSQAAFPVPAARAAPYEKGTETRGAISADLSQTHAARAAPYEKGTET